MAVAKRRAPRRRHEIAEIRGIRFFDDGRIEILDPVIRARLWFWHLEQFCQRMHANCQRAISSEEKDSDGGSGPGMKPDGEECGPIIIKERKSKGKRRRRRASKTR